MVRSIFSKATWLGRATLFVVGSAMVLFLTLAIVAGAADGAKVPSLKKGVSNTVKSMTTLIGSIASPILKLDNDGTGPALELEVEQGNAPLKVNQEAATATNLSADELDGKNSDAFLGSSLYQVLSAIDGNGLGQEAGAVASCEQGDVALNGGVQVYNRDEVWVTASQPVGTGAAPTGWLGEFQDNLSANSASVVVWCVDQAPPAHNP
jgi:hypothetical protein